MIIRLLVNELSEFALQLSRREATNSHIDHLPTLWTACLKLQVYEVFRHELAHIIKFEQNQAQQTFQTRNIVKSQVVTYEAHYHYDTQNIKVPRRFQSLPPKQRLPYSHNLRRVIQMLLETFHIIGHETHKERHRYLGQSVMPRTTH